MKNKTNLSLSLALIAILSVGFSGCGSDGSSSEDSTATDITVERGKVFDATVMDSSTPAQIATQKPNANIYTFAAEPTYPVIVTGGWIDVNANGVKDVGDVNLSITMRSYTNVVTPVSTYIADSNATIREQRLSALRDRLNTQGVGNEGNVSNADLLQLPSEAGYDVIVLSNAIYKDVVENGDLGTHDNNRIMSQFSSVQGLTTSTSALGIEEAVVDNLVGAGFAHHFTESELPHNNPTGDTADLSSYDVIWIYKNASTLSTNAIISNATGELNFGHINSSASSSCTEYGFSNPTSMTYEGVTTLQYVDAQQNKICAEIDYSNTIVSGNENITAYWNVNEHGDSEMGDGSDFGGGVDIGNGDSSGGNVIPGDDSSLSSNGSIYIFNNADASVHVTQQEVGLGTLQMYESTTPIHCTNYGYSNLVNEGTNANGVHSKNYFSNDMQNVCIELDYENSAQYSGSTNIALYEI